jgi:hypothetical protein
MLIAFEGQHKLSERLAGRRMHMLGTSGTVTTVAGIQLGLKRYDRNRVDGCWLNVDDVRGVTADLLGRSYDQRVAEPCIGRDRADLVLAGCAILEAILRMWPCERLRVADRGLGQLIVLGAGLDTSVSRGFDGRVFAVDRPDVLAWRAELVAEAGIADASTLVAADLTEPGLMDALLAAGLDAVTPTAVVALGLSMYLTAADNRTWLTALSCLPPGSVVVFDALLPDVDADEAGRAYAAAITASAGGREPWHWRPGANDVAQVLQASGWGRVAITAESDAVPTVFWQANPGLVRQRLVQLIHAQVPAPTTLVPDESAG